MHLKIAFNQQQSAFDLQQFVIDDDIIIVIHLELYYRISASGK